jgi:protein-L-isoaspartate(D-aspartate) O-methyltransferase
LISYIAKKKRLLEKLKDESGIKDRRVLDAIEWVPRDKFVPDGPLQTEAWDDIALPIGEGQTISQPTVVAVMTEALELTDRHKVLEIGTGSGYQAAILSRLCRRVYTVERHKPLLDQAEKMFKALRLGNVTTICADGMKGWPRIHNIDQHPFDRVIVTCAAKDAPPPALIDQLCDAYSFRNIMPVRFVPLLPDVAGAPKSARGEAA